MRDELDVEEPELGALLKAYVSRAVRPREPERVVATVVASPSPRLALRVPRPLGVAAIGVFVVAAIGAVAIGYLGTQSASSVATATVNGMTYNLAAARNLDVPAAALEPYGSASQIQADASWFEGSTVYAIQGVDPSTVLVLKLTPEARDDAGSLGRFFLLIRGPDAFRSLCSYFDPSIASVPRACR
jgi:hypothetical protein